MTKCGRKCEVYSRVVGYYRPVERWNKGKQQEFKERKVFVQEISLKSNLGDSNVPTLNKSTVQKTLDNKPMIV